MRVFNSIYTALQLGHLGLVLRVYKSLKGEKR
jgi:hypothetical protein